MVHLIVYVHDVCGEESAQIITWDQWKILDFILGGCFEDENRFC